MKILGLIPARGGSRGVPGKNIKLLAGKPLIAYTIEQAQKSSCLDRVILSTDDKAIATVARKHGLEVPFMRPDSLATDKAGSLEVIQHALDFVEQQGEKYDAVCLLQVTSPYRPVGAIDAAINLYKETPDADSLISVRQVPDEFNPHWVFEQTDNNLLMISTGEKIIIPQRQALPATYHRDGAIYISSANVIRNLNSILGQRIISYHIDSPVLINIDTLDDWEKAEKYFENFNKN